MPVSCRSLRHQHPMERPARHRHLQLRHVAAAVPVQGVSTAGCHRAYRMTSIDDIRERLTEIRPPGFPRDIIALGMVRGIDSNNGAVTIHLEPPAMAAHSLEATTADIRRAVGALDGVRDVTVRVTQASRAPSAGSPP